MYPDTVRLIIFYANCLQWIKFCNQPLLADKWCQVSYCTTRGTQVQRSLTGWSIWQWKAWSARVELNSNKWHEFSLRRRYGDLIRWYEHLKDPELITRSSSRLSTRFADMQSKQFYFVNASSLQIESWDPVLTTDWYKAYICRPHHDVDVAEEQCRSIKARPARRQHHWQATLACTLLTVVFEQLISLLTDQLSFNGRLRESRADHLWWERRQCTRAQGTAFV